MIKTTPANAGCRKVLFAPLMSGIFLRKPQKLSSVQLSVAYLFLDEDIWFDSRKKSKQKTEAFASVSLFWLPFLDLNQRPPMIKTTPANAGCRKVWLVCLTTHICYAKRQSFRQNLSARDWMSIDENFGICSTKNNKTKNRPIGRFLVLWLPFLDLNQRPPD